MESDEVMSELPMTYVGTGAAAVVLVRWTRGCDVARAGRVELPRTTGRCSVAGQRPHQATPVALPAAAVVDLQRAAGNRAVARRLAVQRDVPEPKELGTAGKELGDVQEWAQDQQRSQKVLDTSAVVGLDLSQKTNVVEAIRALSAALPALRKATSPFGPGLAALRLALGKANATAAALKVARDELDRFEAKRVLKEGQAAMAKALDALQGVKGVNAQIKKSLKSLHDNMAGTEGIYDTINGISHAIQGVQALDTVQGVKPEAVERVLFLLRSFVAVNDPAASDVPKPAEVVAMKGQMGSMQTDFAHVFGSDAQLGLFIDYADRLVRQIDVRDSMTKAGAPINQVPGEADARAYFTKLKKQPKTPRLLRLHGVHVGLLLPQGGCQHRRPDGDQRRPDVGTGLHHRDSSAGLHRLRHPGRRAAAPRRRHHGRGGHRHPGQRRPAPVGQRH